MATDVSHLTNDGADETREALRPEFTHLLAEFDCQDELLKPVKHSARIKYSCLDVSKQYIALGTSTGSVYIFQRDSLKYILQLSSSDGSIHKLLFARGCDRLAVVTWDGLIVVWELNIEQRKAPIRILTSTTHKDFEISCLAWDESGNRVFAGDNRGWVTITNVDSKKPSGIFKLLSEVILKADSQIVQLDFFKNDLLVSTLTRCHVCLTRRKKCATIGKKLREGFFGACFWRTPTSQDAIVLSARPGSRIWEANIKGEVLKTHQFKKLLALPPLPLVSLKSAICPTFAREGPSVAQSLTFMKLLPIGERFILALATSGLYVLDLENLQVVLWTDSIKDITSMALFGRDIYCLHSNQQICKYSLVGSARCAAKLYRRDRLEESLRICIMFQSCIKQQRSRSQLSLHTMRSMLQRLEETGKEKDSVQTLREMLSDIETTQGDTVSMASSHGSSDSGDIVRLESGIHLIRRRNNSENSEDDQFRHSLLVAEGESSASLFVPSDSDCREKADGKQEMASASVQEVESQRSLKVIRAEEGAHNKVERTDDFFDTSNLENQSSQDADCAANETELDSSGQSMENISSRDTTTIVAVPSEVTSGNHPTRDIGGSIENNTTSSNENLVREISCKMTETHQTSLGVDNIEQSTKDRCDGNSPEPGPHGDDTCNYRGDLCSWNNSNSVSLTHWMDNLLGNSGELSPGEMKQGMTESHESEENTMLQGDSVTDVTPLVVRSSCPGDESPQARQILENEYRIKQHSEDVMPLERVTNSKEADIKLIPNIVPSQHEESDIDEDVRTRDDAGLDEDGVSFMKSEVEGCLNVIEDGPPLVNLSYEKVMYLRSDSGVGKDQMELSNGRDSAAPELIRDSSPARVEMDGTDRGEGMTVGAWSADDRVSMAKSDTKDVKVTAETDSKQNGSCDVSFPEFLQLPEHTVVHDAHLYSPVKEQDILLSKLEDTKAIILKEKKKKLKKAKREPRIVEIGTVKSPRQSPPPPPISKSPIPPTSPSKTPLAITSTSPQISSPGTKNSTKESSDSIPGTLSSESISESPEESVVNGEHGNRSIQTAPDISLAKMGHSFKTVTRSLSQKLNKISPTKMSQSSDVTSHDPSSPLGPIPPETVVNFETMQRKILEEATEMVRLQLTDTSVRLDSGTRTTTLKIWMKVLEGVLQNVVENRLRNGELEDEKPGTGEQLKSSARSPRSGRISDSPSVTLEAIRSLQMSDDLFSDCCQFVWSCFECEAFGSDESGSPNPDESRVTENSDVFHEENEIVLESVSDHDGSMPNGGAVSDRLHGKGVEPRLGNSDLTNEPLGEKSWHSDIYLVEKPHKIQSAVTFNSGHDTSSPDQATPHGVTMAIQQQKDRLASRFIWRFYPFLDPLKIRDAIDKWVIREVTFQRLLEAEEATSEDQIWLKLQNLHQDTLENAVREVKDCLREKPVLAMACLNRIKALAVKGTDMSSILHQCYPYVRFWEAIHLLKGTENHGDQIMSFVTMVAFHEGSRTSFFLNELKNVSLRCFLLSIALAQSPPPRSKLECALCKLEPVPLSNRLWSRHNIVNCILNISNPDENLQDMLNLCYKHGHWSGVVKLHKVKGQRKAALKMMLKLADPRLLHETAGIYPQSFVEWHQVFTYLQSFSPVLPVSSLKPDRLENLCVDCRRKSSTRLDDLTSGPPAEGDSCDPMVVHSNLLREECDTKELCEVEVQSGDLSHDTLHGADCSDVDTSTTRIQEGDHLQNTVRRDGTFERESGVGGVQMPSSGSQEGPRDGSKMGRCPDPKVKEEMSLSWEHVAGLLLESVGPHHALKLLQAYPIPNGALSAKFFRKCLRKARMDAKERTSKEKEGEGTWEEERSPVHPLVRECLAAEMTQTPSVPAETESWYTVHSQQLHKMHWGRNIDLSSDCQMCGWSLQSFTSNLYVYPCGHLYHKDCTSSQDGCIVCSSERCSESR